MKKPLHIVPVQRPISMLNDTPQLVQMFNVEELRNLQKVAADLAVATTAINAAIQRIQAYRLPIDRSGMWSALTVCNHISQGAGQWVELAQHDANNVEAMSEIVQRYVA